MTRLGIFLLWLLHGLPLRLLARLGNGLGTLLYHFARDRRHVVLTNLRLCFPSLDGAAREQLAREHFRAFGRSFLERGILWWGGESRIRSLVQLEGLEYLNTDKPVILLAPHFVGLDMGWTRLTLERPMLSMYAKQKNRVFNKVLLASRLRFGGPLLLSRQEGIRATVKAIREGRPFYYLPDMDYGRRNAIFVDFCGVPAATITGLSRLAQLTGAAVHTCITEMRPGGEGYITRIGPAWSNFPTEDIEGDTRRMNAAIEHHITAMPAQYYWVHKRFKTRPLGEKRPY